MSTNPGDSSTGPPDQATYAEPSHQWELKEKFAGFMGESGQLVKHRKTSVLMMYWDQDCTDFHVEEEVFDLRDVFTDLYGFKVVTKALSRGQRPQLQANHYLSEFAFNEDAKNGLLIVYYAGHGGSKASELGHITLSGGKDESEGEEGEKSTINWPRAETGLLNTQSDVFQIFDCCHAGLLCAPIVRTTRCFELLGACHANGTTPMRGPGTFTAAFTWALKGLHTQAGFHSNKLLQTIQSAPNLARTQEPVLYSSRYETHGEHLYIHPIGRSSSESPGKFRDQLEKEAKTQAKNEQLLDLRFHFQTDVGDSDLENIAVVLRTAQHQKRILAHRVSLVGKYNIETYNRKRHDLAGRTALRWMQRTRRNRNVSLAPNGTPELPVEAREALTPSLPTSSPEESGDHSPNVGTGSVGSSQDGQKHLIARTPSPKRTRRKQYGSNESPK